MATEGFKRKLAAISSADVLDPTAAPQVEKASKDEVAFPLTDKPSITLTPFVNVTGDENRFCDDLSGRLIMALSKLQGLFVTARESTFS